MTWTVDDRCNTDLRFGQALPYTSIILSVADETAAAAAVDR